MDFTAFAGKYRLEEEIANGGCGMLVLFLLFDALKKWFILHRDRILGRTHRGWQRSRHKTRTSSGKA